MERKLLFTAQEVLEWRHKQLSFGGISSDLDWLIDIGGGLGWEQTQKLKIFQTGTYLFAISLNELECIWRQHIQGQIPLQYLLGRCPWSDFELEVTKAVLIPRQETEILLELALKKACEFKSGLWADLGTGSGALAVGLARSLPDWNGHAVDVSKSSLIVAEKNLHRLAPHTKVEVHLGDWLEPLKPWWGFFDLVVSNPPYIPSSVMKQLDPIIRNNEPHLALNGGDDGMDSCRMVVKGAFNALKRKGFLIFEHHYDQSEKALKLLLENGFEEVAFHNDLDGVRRFAIGRHP